MYKKITICISTVLLIIAFIVMHYTTVLGSFLFIVGIVGNVLAIFIPEKDKEKGVELIYNKIKNKDL